ncbi:hypothetical protein DFH06DRAFT_1124364 [Mycena polygramma]|nr:hypothetical protein DFH06DRAFT_1124364 [Mycena polygramma]
MNTLSERLVDREDRVVLHLQPEGRVPVQEGAGAGIGRGGRPAAVALSRMSLEGGVASRDLGSLTERREENMLHMFARSSATLVWTECVGRGAEVQCDESEVDDLELVDVKFQAGVADNRFWNQSTGYISTEEKAKKGRKNGGKGKFSPQHGTFRGIISQVCLGVVHQKMPGNSILFTRYTTQTANKEIYMHENSMSQGSPSQPQTGCGWQARGGYMRRATKTNKDSRADKKKPVRVVVDKRIGWYCICSLRDGCRCRKVPVQELDEEEDRLRLRGLFEKNVQVVAHVPRRWGCVQRPRESHGKARGKHASHVCTQLRNLGSKHKVECEPWIDTRTRRFTAAKHRSLASDICFRADAAVLNWFLLSKPGPWTECVGRGAEVQCDESEVDDLELVDVKFQAGVADNRFWNQSTGYISTEEKAKKGRKNGGKGKFSPQHGTFRGIISQVCLGVVHQKMPGNSILFTRYTTQTANKEIYMHENSMSQGSPSQPQTGCGWQARGGYMRRATKTNKDSRADKKKPVRVVVDKRIGWYCICSLRDGCRCRKVPVQELDEEEDRLRLRGLFEKNVQVVAHVPRRWGCVQRPRESHGKARGKHASHVCTQLRNLGSKHKVECEPWIDTRTRRFTAAKHRSLASDICFRADAAVLNWFLLSKPGPWTECVGRGAEVQCDESEVDDLELVDVKFQAGVADNRTATGR